MKKWTFWGTMCLLSLANGALFFAASLSSMRRGIAGADNQAALLFIPLLWLAAAGVLVILNFCTLFYGRAIHRGDRIGLLSVFRLSELPETERVNRVLFFGAAGALMLFAYSLFASKLLSLFYALTGGLLLLFLYAWNGAALENARR